MKQNKWIALGLAAALSLGLFAGCAKEEEKQDDQQPQDEKTENQDQNGRQAAEGGDLLQRIKDKGEIVVAMLEDEATVKTLRRKNGHTWLLPENPEYDPIDGDGCQILGRVVAVIRRY